MKNYAENLPSPDEMKKEEIVNLLLTEEYGFLPPPSSVTAEITDCEDRFCAGKVILKRINLSCPVNGKIFTFPITFSCPKSAENSPVPCFIHINFRPDVPDRFQPTEEITDKGYAILSFCYKDVTSDNADFTDGLAGIVYPNGRTSNSDCGKIGLWAWAAMRVMDYAQTLPELKSDRISVVGHSRLGKTALLTGALDERFFCAFSNDSGCSGAALARGNSGETIADIYANFPYWFCENYSKYINAEDSLPFDQHFLIAANAPHRVYVASAENDSWADPKNEYFSCIAASRYYEKRAVPGFLHPDRLPMPEDFFPDGYIGYHMRSGDHYLSRKDWNRFIEYLNRHNG